MNSIFGNPNNYPWYFLDPDNRVDEPSEPHCARCKRKMRTDRKNNFMVCEVNWETCEVRAYPGGKELIGSDCWKIITSESKQLK